MVSVWISMTLVTIFCVKAALSSEKHVDVFHLRAVYYELAPFLHKDPTNQSDKLIGLIPDMLSRMEHLCNIKVDLAYNADTMENFTQLLSPNKIKELGDDVIWLPLIKQFSREHLQAINMTQLHMFNSHGFEVVVSRNKVNIIAKFNHGIYGCRYHIVFGGIASMSFAVFIWLCVSY